MIQGKPLLIDLDKLRVGMLFDLLPDKDTGFLKAKVLPFNSFGLFDRSYEYIENIPKEAILRIPNRLHHGKLSFPEYVILLAGEKGQGYFIEKYLESTVPQMLRSLQEMRDQTSIASSALKTKQRDVLRGEAKVLAKVSEQAKLLTVPREEFDKKKKRRSILDG